MLKWINIALVLYAAFLGLLHVSQRLLIYLPDRHEAEISKAKWAQPFTVKTADGLTLTGWWSPPATDQMPVIAFFHGNAGNLEVRIEKAEPYIKQGYGVLLAEYRGYGGHDGKPTEAGLYTDARAYLTALQTREHISSDRLIIYGESLGSGVATQMATEFKSKALVLDVPFSNLADVSQHRFPAVMGMDLLLKDKYKNDEKIGAIDRPVFIGVGDKDIIVPMKFGLKLAAAAQEPKTVHVYKGAGHMGVYDRGFAQDVIAFIDALND